MGRNNRGDRKMNVKKMTPNITYIDMDGVIADFFGGLAKEFNVNHWKDIPTQQEVIDRLTGSDFFSRISIFPTTVRFLHMIERYTKGRWAILSTPLKGDEENSSNHKDKWLDQVFSYAFDNDFNKKRFYSDTIYTNLKHVSKSGLTRDIQLMVMKDNEPLFLNYYVSKYLGYRIVNGGLRVSGGGMDMGFHLVYNLASKLGVKLNHQWI
jgi:hypothetical protein